MCWGKRSTTWGFHEDPPSEVASDTLLREAKTIIESLMSGEGVSLEDVEVLLVRIRTYLGEGDIDDKRN